MQDALDEEVVVHDHTVRGLDLERHRQEALDDGRVELLVLQAVLVREQHAQLRAAGTAGRAQRERWRVRGEGRVCVLT